MAHPMPLLVAEEELPQGLTLVRAVVMVALKATTLAEALEDTQVMVVKAVAVV